MRTTMPPPPPHHSFPSPGRNRPVLEACLQMGETEAQINGEPVPELWWDGYLKYNSQFLASGRSLA